MFEILRKTNKQTKKKNKKKKKNEYNILGSASSDSYKPPLSRSTPRRGNLFIDV